MGGGGGDAPEDGGERERGRVWHRHRRLTGVQEGEEEEVGKLN